MKHYFYSKKTNNLIVEIEYFPNSNTFVFWTYNPLKEDVALYNSIGLIGTDELSEAEGNNFIKTLKENKKLTY